MAFIRQIPAIAEVNWEAHNESSHEHHQPNSASAGKELPEVPSKSFSSCAVEPLVEVLRSEWSHTRLRLALLRKGLVPLCQLRHINAFRQLVLLVLREVLVISSCRCQNGRGFVGHLCFDVVVVHVGLLRSQRRLISQNGVFCETACFGSSSLNSTVLVRTVGADSDSGSCGSCCDSTESG